MPSCKTRFQHLCLPVLLILLSESVSARANLADSGAKNSSSACFEEERKALLEFRRSLGDSLPGFSSWKGEACCNWSGVGCSRNTGHVVRLELPYICVVRTSDNVSTDAPISTCPGELSRSLLNLTHLDYLDLRGNNFSSVPIPSFIASLEQLRYLDLSGLGFVGLFPPELGNLLQLRTLDLSQNSISGSLPESIGNLIRLRTLDLSFNSISGSLPESIGNLIRLRTLDLSFNSISGSLPASIGNLINLESLRLSRNRISGPFLLSLGNLSHLDTLDLSFNMIKGTIPNSIGQLRELRDLNLLSNLWEGVIGESHFENLTRLGAIQLSSNSKSLVLNFSQKWVPPFNAPFISIRDCRFASPAFPSWLRNQSITSIELSNVGISDTIPDWFWRNSPRLIWLDLSNNQLRGKLPVLDQMGGFVILENNSLEGSIPLWPNVTYLNLRTNMFSGPIPLSIGREMLSLISLDLSRNFLSGSIPASLTRITSLSTIDLSRNFLSGSIPQNWTSSAEILTLDLSNNFLSGQIPPSLCSQQPSLYWLRLNTNNLSGELGLRNCSRLHTLDLGGNKFSGSIPQWIGEDLQSLSYLVLGGNNFTGSIPQQLCSLSFLHVLDLSRNALSGSLPTCLGNLTQLTNLASKLQPFPSRSEVLRLDPWHLDLHPKGVEYEYTTILPLVNTIDLSSNDLTGEIPQEIRNLTNLGSLNLSRNMLTGNIPEDIGVLQRLQALDLSGNNLEGAIPRSMTNMTFLSVLNLSHNNLSGPIPFGNQFQTFNDPALFEGNLGLCGAPLPTQCSSNPDGNPKVEEDEDEGSNMWLYVSTVTGFVMGFWAVFGSLVLKKSWRHAYFKFVDDMKERLVVGIITLKLTKQGRQA